MADQVDQVGLQGFVLYVRLKVSERRHSFLDSSFLQPWCFLAAGDWAEDKSSHWELSLYAMRLK